MKVHNRKWKMSGMKNELFRTTVNRIKIVLIRQGKNMEVVMTVIKTFLNDYILRNDNFNFSYEILICQT